MMIIFVLVCSAVIKTQAYHGFGPTEQDWGYIDVRNNAHIFWWLHYTTATSNYTDRPLAIWLQGGPGMSSTGFGNFGEIGPLDLNLKSREYAWTNDMNVLFVDSPVGSGYSYVSSVELLVKNDQEIVDDFLVFLRKFLEKHPELSKLPLYIFGESYGGKMTAEIGLALYQAIQNKTIACNLKGLGFGDSWISPIDYVISWGSYLLNLGFVDEFGYNNIQRLALKTKEAYDNNDHEKATFLWANTQAIIFMETMGVDFYNVLSNADNKMFRSIRRPGFIPMDQEKVEKLMNSKVKDALNLTVTWGKMAGKTFQALKKDFMKPVTDKIEVLLNTTSLKLAVYNGQLDLIVDTPGTVAWTNRLKWKNSDDWYNATREEVTVNGIQEGFVKIVDNFALYWIHRAGHSVPYDNPQAMNYILRNITNNFEIY